MQDRFNSSGKHGYYKPTATRAPTIIVLLVITLSLIGLTEHALRVIPNHTGVGKLSTVVDTLDKLNARQLVRRQIASDFIPEPSTPTGPPEEEFTLTASTPKWGDLELGTPTESPVANPTPTLPDPTPTLPDPTLIIVNAPTVLPEGPFSDPSPPSSQSIATAGSGYLDVGAVATPTAVNGAAPTQNSQQNQITTAPGLPKSVSSNTGITSAAKSGYLNGASATPGIPKGGYLGDASSDDGPKPTATIISANGTFLAYPDGSTVQAPQITLQQYVLVAFVPLLLSVLFTLPWRILDTAIREMEPFYQLHDAGGARAEDSLTLDYVTAVLAAMPFKSLKKGHMYVFWSSLISIAVLILTPLSSEVFFVSLSGVCRANAPKGSCHAAWGVYTTLARLTQGILAFIAVLTTLILIFGFNRKSGVYSEPLSIAGLAVLFHKSPLLQGFREIDSRISNADLSLVLKGKRFGTAPFTSRDSTQCYGILPVDPDSEIGFVSQPQETGFKGRYGLVQTTEMAQTPIISDSIETAEDKPKYSFWAGVGEKVYLASALIVFLGVFTLVAYYHWTSGDTPFERFMSSEGFGVRFMLAALGVVMKLFWSMIDEDLRRMEPYRRLLRGSSRAEDSILVPVWMSPLSAIIPSLRRSHFLVALVSFVSVLSEFLPISLANSTFSAGNTRQALNICTYISLSVLLLMIVTVTILIFRPKHHIRRLPRLPTNLASVLLFLTHADAGDNTNVSMVDRFQGLAMVPKRERNEYIRSLRALYTMGLVAGNDLRIDEDRNVHRLWAN